MSSLEKRLVNLERAAEDAAPVMPGLVLFFNGDAPTEAQQREIDQAEANGQQVIIFNVVDASENGGMNG
ncbi:hypothetical protein [Methylobacter sp.]|uniref:hypothetical protein n=1 Tax=Methylobacter sp. TaxID=2051955 RepID=UPI002FDD2C4A